MARDPHPTLPQRRKPEPPQGTPEHEEWLLDEAVAGSFPASDPPAPAQPSSTVSVNHIADEGRRTPPTDEELRNTKGKKN